MTQSNFTPEQQAQLLEALELAEQFEDKMKELSKLGDAFAQKWEDKLKPKDLKPQKSSLQA